MTTPTLLDDHRIDSMRERIMADVDADVRRRGRRARFAAGTVAAAVIIVGGVAGVAAVSGGPDQDTSIAYSPADSSPADSDSAAAPDAIPDMQVLPESEAMPIPADGSKVSPRDEADRAVVTNGQVTLVVDDPTDAATDFGSWVEAQGGRVDHRSDREGITSVTVRVPADQVNAAIEQLRAVGEVETTSIDKVDVTATLVDLDARIAALRASIDRLTQILVSATTTSEVVEAEANLTQRQAELDGLVAQRTALGDEVALSTLDITFAQTPTTATVEPGGFLGGLRTGWNSVVEAVNSLATGLGVAAPWLGIAAVLGGAAWLVVRRRA